jgi:hypothetical protein
MATLALVAVHGSELRLLSVEMTGLEPAASTMRRKISWYRAIWDDTSGQVSGL